MVPIIAANLERASYSSVHFVLGRRKALHQLRNSGSQYHVHRLLLFLAAPMLLRLRLLHRTQFAVQLLLPAAAWWR